MANGTSAPAVIVQQSPNSNGGTITSVAGGLFDAFKTSPTMLLIVVLNGIFIGCGGWYAIQIEAYRADDRKGLIELMSKCLTDTVPISYLRESSRPYGRENAR